jgi:DHA2 family methylenomycin A resistance protein-like MFS transporter
MRRAIAACLRYAEKQMEPDVNISIKPRSQTGHLIALRDRRARAIARNARVAKALTLAAMSLGYVVVQLDVTIVNVAINSIGADFGGSIADLQWIVNAYTITFAAFILTAGALGDRLGARRVFVAGFAIFALASLACALAPALRVLIIARLCQGLGAAILVPNSLALLNHAYPQERERHWAVGIWAAGASFSLTAGPLVGGALIALSGWRSIFLINLPIGLAGIWLTWRYATETARLAARTLDLPGQITAVLALGSLAAAMIEGGERGWSDLFVLKGFASFAVLAALLLAIEFRSQAPMLPLGCSASLRSARCP